MTPWTNDERLDGQRRADALIHLLVTRLAASLPTHRLRAPVRPLSLDSGAARPPGFARTPAGKRSGEGADSVLPYLSPPLRAK